MSEKSMEEPAEMADHHPLLFILLPLLVTAACAAAGFTRCLLILAILLSRERMERCRHRARLLEVRAPEKNILVIFLGGTIGCGWCECKGSEMLGRFPASCSYLGALDGHLFS
jgi:hypothetical protein